MYGKLHKIASSKMALWGVTAFAVVLFCLTAAIAFGMHAHRKAASQAPAEKIPSVQPTVSTLQVQNSDASSTQPSQLQGQPDNAKVSQPAAAAAASNVPELSAGIAATELQQGATNSGTSGVQAQIDAAGLNIGAQANLP